jgi:hypothetical protein
MGISRFELAPENVDERSRAAAAYECLQENSRQGARDTLLEDRERPEGSAEAFAELCLGHCGILVVRCFHCSPGRIQGQRRETRSHSLRAELRAMELVELSLLL